MKKILLTGSSGMVGAHLLKRFIDCEVYLYNRGQDFQTVLNFKPDVIYHVAAEIYENSLMFESNIVLTQSLLEIARKLPNLKAFVYIGSSSEYGRKEHPMTETDYLDPSNMYEATKGAGSLLCQAYFHQFNVPTVIARPFSLYGKYEPPHRLIPTVIRKLKTNSYIQLAEGVHDFIHVDDFIDGLFLLEKKPNGEIYNFGTGVQTTNFEVVQTIAEVSKKEARIKKVKPLRSFDSNCWVADISKARTLGWEPKYSLLEGLTQVIKGEYVRD